MSGFDPNNVKFGPQRPEPSVFRDYLEQVAQNPNFLAYKRESQHGGKKGESLYTHILNGVMLLESLRRPLGLSDIEARLLFTVFTIHDINKDPDFDNVSYTKLAIPANFEKQIAKLGLNEFFPQYNRYLTEITAVAAQHGGHSGGLSIAARPGDQIPRDRLEQLLALIRAVDIVDLSHTLDEQRHKATFLSYLNEVFDNNQYAFYIHRLAENRGTLTNMIHQSLVNVLQEEGLIPLLYYPDGVAYLIPRGTTLTLTPAPRRRLARRAAKAVNDLTGQEFESFIVSAIAGIKVDPKCLELGIPFPDLWQVMHTRAQTRNLDRENLVEKIVDRTQRSFAKNKEGGPETADLVQEKLANPANLIPTNLDRLRDGELVRTYYIFLNSHFSQEISDAWDHIYDLLELPPESRQWLGYFDARWDRPYVFINQIDLSHETIYERIEQDGTTLLNAQETDDEKVDLFADYLERYALFGPMGRVTASGNGRFSDHLAEYVDNQHKQCVHCSTIFPTDKWMTNDVRSDITVQTFSNRLRGGPGEPKKYICQLCQIQFLVERLNYEEVRGEKTMYLHFFPYSFLPAPFLAAMRDEISRIRQSDAAVRALWCDTRTAFLDQSKGVNPDFATQTKKGKPHPYGIYMPRVPRHTVGNRLIFPINPAGENDSQRFLYALWNALVLQQHFGLRVMLTESPVAPFVPDVELYIDNVALSCRGLIDRNDYGRYANFQEATDGPLVALQKQAQALHRLAGQLRTASKRDEMLALVQAMANGPLHIFYTAEKLLEARSRDDQSANPEWLEIRLAQRTLPDLEILIAQKGGNRMAQLSQHLQKLAEIAWQGGLRGKTLKKNSLMTPLDHIFQKLNQRSQAFDDEALKAVIIEDIFEYLDRIADEQYAPGRRKMTAATDFVETFFRDVYQHNYQSNRTRLLADEKLLRSAYMFYIRQQIQSKKSSGESDETSEE
jgi:CRISPR-associated protein Csc3